MSKTQLTKRYLLFIISLFFCALGVAITKRGELGVSPTSSVANVLSSIFPALSLGGWLILWNCLLIVGQIVLLRRDFQPVQLMQLPLSFLFGRFTDFGMWLTGFLPVPHYAAQLVMVIAGTFLLGFGIALAVIANVVMNAGEAFVKAVSQRFDTDFGHTKIGFDVFCVLAAVLLSLLCFDGAVVGTREGTLFAALCTGFVVNAVTVRLQKPLARVLA